MHRLNFLNWATILGAVPLTAGTLIYILWRLTRSSAFEFFGIVTIFFGTIAFLLGIVLLGAYFVSEWSQSRPRRIPLWLQVVLVGLLLVSNFPAAFYFVTAAEAVKNRYRLVVVSESDQSIESFLIIHSNQRLEAGPISPGSQTVATVPVISEGAITFTARQGKHHLAGEVEGYVTHGMGGSKTIRIKSDRQVEISENYPEHYANRD